MLHQLQFLFESLDFAAMGNALLRVLAIFLCLTVHEASHGLAAYVLGDPTAKAQHRLSLNPLRHIDWFGLLMMFTVGFGWAKAVPVNPRYFRKPKQGMAVTALAGRFPICCWPPRRWASAASSTSTRRIPAVERPLRVFPADPGPAFHRFGIVQPDSHSAAGRVQGGGSVLAR